MVCDITNLKAKFGSLGPNLILDPDKPGPDSSPTFQILGPEPELEARARQFGPEPEPDFSNFRARARARDPSPV